MKLNLPKLYVAARSTFPPQEVYEICVALGLDPVWVDNITMEKFDCFKVNSYNRDRRTMRYNGKNFIFYNIASGMVLDIFHIVHQATGNNPVEMAKYRLTNYEPLIDISQINDDVARGFMLLEPPIPERNQKFYHNSTAACSLSKEWEDEGIPYEVQQRFKLEYNKSFNQIVIPYYYKDIVVGAKLRNFNTHYNGKKLSKYISVPGTKKSQFVYGLTEANYTDTIIIYEGEKAVIKSHAYGIDNCVSVGGKFVSGYHAYQLNQVGIKNIILAFDSDLKIEELDKQIKNLGMYFDVYVVDMKDCGYKENITDLSKEQFLAALQSENMTSFIIPSLFN